MSVRHKQARLVEIRKILSGRCTANSELHFMLMREKKRLENELSSSKNYKKENHKPEDKYRSEKSHQKYKHFIREKSPSLDNSRSLTQSSPEIKHVKVTKEAFKKTTKEHAALAYKTKQKEKTHRSHHNSKNIPEQQKCENAKNHLTGENDSSKHKKQRSAAAQNPKPTFNLNKVSADKSAEFADQADELSHNRESENKSVVKNVSTRHRQRKTFTKEEIQQMSSHTKKKPPTYINPPKYSPRSIKKVSIAIKPDRSKTECKDSMDSLDQTTLSQNNESSASGSQISVTKDELVNLKKPLTSSKFSPTLLKLQGDQQKIIDAKRSTEPANNLKRFPKSTAPPKAVKSEKRIPTPQNRNDAGSNDAKRQLNSDSSVSTQPDIKFQNGSKLYKGQVVFTLDMDDLPPKEKKNVSFFPRNIFRKKKFSNVINRGTQTENLGKSQATQSNPWAISDLLKSIQTQTTLNTQVRSTQTQKVSSHNKEIQISPQVNSSSTQTFDITQESFHNRLQVSLDDLVQHKRQRKAKSVMNRKTPQDELQISGQLQRSATLQTRTKENLEKKREVKKIKSFNWSQTEKFIKVIVSHNGVHLIPFNQIQVKSNGVNLKVVIDENEFPFQGNGNENNNNNKNESEIANNKHELFLERLCHPVTNLSFTIQPDMVAILLRKKAEKTWKNLQSQKDSLIQTAAQVYL